MVHRYAFFHEMSATPPTHTGETGANEHNEKRLVTSKTGFNFIYELTNVCLYDQEGFCICLQCSVTFLLQYSTARAPVAKMFARGIWELLEISRPWPYGVDNNLNWHSVLTEDQLHTIHTTCVVLHLT